MPNVKVTLRRITVDGKSDVNSHLIDILLFSKLKMFFLGDRKKEKTKEAETSFS